MNYWAAHGYPALKRNAIDIQSAAEQANINPIWFASLLLRESRADYNTKPGTVNGKVTGVGIGQINPMRRSSMIA